MNCAHKPNYLIHRTQLHTLASHSKKASNQAEGTVTHVTLLMKLPSPSLLCQIFRHYSKYICSETILFIHLVPRRNSVFILSLYPSCVVWFTRILALTFCFLAFLPLCMPCPVATHSHYRETLIHQTPR